MNELRVTTRTGENFDLENATMHVLDRAESNYDSPDRQAYARTAATTDMLARLMTILHATGALTDEHVLDILGHEFTSVAVREV